VGNWRLRLCFSSAAQIAHSQEKESAGCSGYTDDCRYRSSSGCTETALA